MENELKALEGIKSLVNQLELISYGNNAIQHLNIEKYDSGITGFLNFKNDINQLDLSKAIENTTLKREIKKLKNEHEILENSNTNLKIIIGDVTEGKEGSIASSLIDNLQKEIERCISKRNELETDILKKENLLEELDEKYDENLKKLEVEFKNKETNLNDNFKTLKDALNNKTKEEQKKSQDLIYSAEKNAKNKVRLINQFRDFLQETNDNMRLYTYVIFAVLFIAILAIVFSIPTLLDFIKNYNSYITNHGTLLTNWQVINYAFGLFIVRLPWAICISFIFSGLYSLLKSVLITYEKINQDKRNMSAIYSISGNVAESLNDYGISLVDSQYDANLDMDIEVIRIKSHTDLEKKKETFRWNQIMKYFEGMNQNKQDVNINQHKNDDINLKFVTDILNKIIDKFPKAS